MARAAIREIAAWLREQQDGDLDLAVTWDNYSDGDEY